MLTKNELLNYGFDITEQDVDELNEHFHNPKNRWALQVFNARGIGKNPNNYGRFDLYMLLDNEEKIEDIGYEFVGCPTIAFSASIYTEAIKGSSLDEAFWLTRNSIEEMAEQENCDKCTQMILLAFLGAYENYQNRKNKIDEAYVIKMLDIDPSFSQQSCG